MNDIIGRVAATEKFPATMDKFYFWTDADFRLNAFDVVKVEHIESSYTFGTVENIFHITDAKSFLTNYISCDFGKTEVIAPTLRVEMNYVEVAVSFNTKNIYTPVKNDSPVNLANATEIEQALGLDRIKNKLPCGFLKMYEGRSVVIGVDIIEIVTKGLYTNSLDIFREYIQNSCDAIDDAVKAGVLAEGEGQIEIEIDASARRIIITDNGLGINIRQFETTMSKIGNHDN